MTCLSGAGLWPDVVILSRLVFSYYVVIGGVMEDIKPSICPCVVCGGFGVFFNVYGSFCAKHYEDLWERLTEERVKDGGA